ncbi:fructosamine kinase family protein [Hyunsoonleella pacifica]|uniref:Fructosamine kinase n=1 Tax=Hyunsoonleella pacifica TaxID=1080224 RepID=A0A4Q9FQD4_9FLAO|nr:fructosamine kinase family protein [Hyunsoonleella pacifica]TBN15436.1 fructosamine kinase [Hyunsoonleella pacifica]GGD24075.1 aminoglycoside phosphotransferase [Hyunsoonleella pacifica]
MSPYFNSIITKALNTSIEELTQISGGDISQAYKISTPQADYFLKVNNAPDALTMFQTEAYGLQSIAKTNTIKTPKVIACDVFENSAFLILEFIASKSPSTQDFKTLGAQLAQLHKCTSKYFGLDSDNFIGLLPQSNIQHKIWVDFYTYQRLQPQLELAKQKGLLQDSECPKPEHIKNKLKPLFEDITPSLLHGDLWSGNYLISKNGTPCLIDPAVYYGHAEVDIAMSKLFGGFSQSFYSAYHDYFPMDINTKTRIEIYQLYYLLVHLNMFGHSYYDSVNSILKRHFT